MPHPLFEKHEMLLGEAVTALWTRGNWSAFAAEPKAYGATALDDGKAAFEAYRGAQFYLDQPGLIERGGGEVSPYGLSLDISYPRCSPDALIAAAQAAQTAWTKAGPATRAGVCAEILSRLNQYSFEIAYAVMHTTGQSLRLAFQSGGPQAQDRGLEAVAMTWRLMRLVPSDARWEKSLDNGAMLRIDKGYTIAPRGISLVVGNATAPTLNTYPGLFASLTAGNPVIVKPHPGCILPLAITVAAARQVLKEAGFDPALVSLLVDEAEMPVTREVATNPAVRLIDYTGNSEFGNWLRENARQATVFTQEGSVNCVVLDSTLDYRGMLRNLAFSLAQYSGQLCRAPRAILVSEEGIRTPEGTVAIDAFCGDLASAVTRLLDDPQRAVEILGAIQSPATAARVTACADEGTVLRPATALEHPQWPQARVLSPLILRATAADTAAWMSERFGPISSVVQTLTVAAAVATAERAAREAGSLVLTLYSTNPVVQQLAADAALRTGVALNLNPVAAALDQNAAFVDFHGSGANPAGNASFVDPGFAAARFVVQMRQQPAG